MPQSSDVNLDPRLTLDSNQAGSPTGTLLTTLLGIVAPDPTAVFGVDCSPISGIGIGGNACSAHAVCCQDNSVVSVVGEYQGHDKLTGLHAGHLRLRRLCPHVLLRSRTAIAAARWLVAVEFVSRAIVILVGHPRECYVEHLRSVGRVRAWKLQNWDQEDDHVTDQDPF